MGGFWGSWVFSLYLVKRKKRLDLDDARGGRGLGYSRAEKMGQKKTVSKNMDTDGKKTFFLTGVKCEGGDLG